MFFPVRKGRPRGRASAVTACSDRAVRMACRKDPTCAHPRIFPVTRREEFAGCEPTTKNHKIPAESADLYLQRDPARNERQGLCAGCESGDGCMFPAPAGSILHCEDLF